MVARADASALPSVAITTIWPILVVVFAVEVDERRWLSAMDSPSVLAEQPR